MKRFYEGAMLVMIGFMVGGVAIGSIATYKMRQIAGVALATTDNDTRNIQELAKHGRDVTQRWLACDQRMGELESGSTVLVEPEATAGVDISQLHLPGTSWPTMSGMLPAFGDKRHGRMAVRWVIPYKVEPIHEGKPEGAMWVWIIDGKAKPVPPDGVTW